MLGFIVGTLCLLALLGTLRRHHFARFHHGYGMAYGYPGGGCGHGPDYGPVGFGLHRPGGRHGLVRALFSRLDTTPGQEKAIGNALQTARERLLPLREGLGEARNDVATAFDAEVFDRARLQEALAQKAGRVHEARDVVIEALASIHATLDERQRKELGQLIRQRGLYAGSCLHRGAC